MKHRLGMTLLGPAFLIAVAGTAFAADDLKQLEEKLLKGECNLCHSSKRVLTVDPAQLATVVERMRKMNPDLFADMRSEHMVQALANILKDPAIVAAREAWIDAVERGRQLFEDTTLGKNGYNCKACHNPPTDVLRNVADAYPRWDPKLKRFVDINEAINRMIVEKLGGERLPPGDQKHFDLVAFLKSL